MFRETVDGILNKSKSSYSSWSR